MADTRLYDIADALLTVVVNAIPSPPSRQYVSNGEVALDCELVAVEMVRVYTGLPGAEVVNATPCRGNAASADYRIWVARCVPSEGTPSAQEIDNSARELLTDGWLLRRAIIAELNDDSSSIVDSCDNARIGPLAHYGPSGGYGGVTMAVAVQL